jgi:hypothetical protein
MTTSLDDARLVYGQIPNATKLAAGLEHPEHRDRRVLPVLETTTLREIHAAVPEGEVVVLATVIGDEVEFGMFTGTGVEPDGLPDPVMDMTMRELISRAMEEGEPGPTPDSPLHNPNA